MLQLLKYILPVCLLLVKVFTIVAQDEKNFELAVEVYLKNGEYKKASRYIQQVKQQEDYSDKLIYLQAKTYYLEENFKEATNFFLQLHNTDKSRANYELAQCYAQLNKPELATKYLAMYLDRHKKKLQNEIKKDEAFEKIQESMAWRELWAKEWYSTYEMELMEAKFRIKNKNYSSALQLLDEMSAKRKKGDEAYYLKAQLFFETQEYSKARDEIVAAIKIEDEAPSYFYLKARIDLSDNKKNKALDAINYALGLDSSNFEYYKTLLKVQLALENFDAAIELADRILNLSASPENLKLAATVYEQSGDYLTALKTINRCIERERYNADLYIQRANIYMATKTYKYAEKDYSMALDFYPYNGEIYYKRGTARYNTGRLEDACNDWFKARKYGYVDAEEKIKKYCRNFLKNK